MVFWPTILKIDPFLLEGEGMAVKMAQGIH